jgi:multidrug efflux pump subunit AcrA (membrane-fusion protein)
MRNVIKTLVTVGVLSFSVLLAYGLVATSPVPEQIVPEEIIKTIRVVQAVSAEINLEVQSQGTVVPHKQSELVPEVNGRVSWMSSSMIVGGFF